LQSIFQTQVNNSVLGGHARQRIDLSGSVTPFTPSTPPGAAQVTAATFFGIQLPSETGQTVGDTALQTAQKIVNNKADILVQRDVIERGITDISLGADGQSVVLEYNQFPKTYFKLNGTMGPTDDPTKFQGVKLEGSAPGDSAAKTALLIVANKKAILADTTPATSLSQRNITDIQIDPTDPDGTTLIFVYNQKVPGPVALPEILIEGHERVLASGNKEDCLVTSKPLTWSPQATVKVAAGLDVNVKTASFAGFQLTQVAVTDTAAGLISTATPAGPNFAA
jgi:hypothetical protein